MQKYVNIRWRRLILKIKTWTKQAPNNLEKVGMNKHETLHL